MVSFWINGRSQCILYAINFQQEAISKKPKQHISLREFVNDLNKSLFFFYVDKLDFKNLDNSIKNFDRVLFSQVINMSISPPFKGEK